MSDHDFSPQPGITASPVAKALAGLIALAVAMGIGRFAFTPVLPMMLQDASVSLVSGGWLASANYLGYLVGALSAMAVRVRPERAIRFGLAAIGIMTLAMGLPLPFFAWLLLRFLAGIASAWVLISVSAWCLESLAAYRQPWLNSLVFAGVGVGIAVAGLLCLTLLHVAASAAQAWVGLGMLAAAATGLAWPFFGVQPHAAGSSKSAAGGRFRWSADALRLVACYGVFGFGYIIPATFLPVMAKNALQGSSLFGWSWPLFGLAAALSTLAVPALVKRIGNRRLWMICHVVMAFGIVLPVLWPNLLTIVCAALGVGGTFMVITLAALQEAKRIAGPHATSLIAAMTSAFATGQIVGPLTVGDGGFSPALMTAAAALLVSALTLRAKEAPFT